MSRPVELIGVTSDITATLTPPEVDLFLTGPVPVLNQIQGDPNLVHATVDVVGVDPPATVNKKVEVIAPAEVQVQVIPDTVEVVLQP
jgi:hypothetical protein